MNCNSAPFWARLGSIRSRATCPQPPHYPQDSLHRARSSICSSLTSRSLHIMADTAWASKRSTLNLLTLSCHSTSAISHPNHASPTATRLQTILEVVKASIWIVSRASSKMRLDRSVYGLRRSRPKLVPVISVFSMVNLRTYRVTRVPTQSASNFTSSRPTEWQTSTIKS